MAIFNGKTHYKWPFSIAMLNYQRVHEKTWTCHMPHAACSWVSKLSQHVQSVPFCQGSLPGQFCSQTTSHQRSRWRKPPVTQTQPWKFKLGTNHLNDGLPFHPVMIWLSEKHNQTESQPFDTTQKHRLIDS